MTTTAHTALTTLLETELALRKPLYLQAIAEGAMTKEQANAQYIPLQVLQARLQGKRISIQIEDSEIVDELERWAREIQRNSSNATRFADGRNIGRIEEMKRYVTGAQAQPAAIPQPTLL